MIDVIKNRVIRYCLINQCTNTGMEIYINIDSIELFSTKKITQFYDVKANNHQDV